VAILWPLFKSENAPHPETSTQTGRLKPMKATDLTWRMGFEIDKAKFDKKNYTTDANCSIYATDPDGVQWCIGTSRNKPNQLVIDRKRPGDKIFVCMRQLNPVSLKQAFDMVTDCLQEAKRKTAVV
jgi:hypothetical protein